MGGHGGFDPIKIDPAIERWSLMRENVYQHFKFNPRTSKHVMIWGLFVPFSLYWTMSHFDRKYNYAGKLKGQSLLRNPPAPARVEGEE